MNLLFNHYSKVIREPGEATSAINLTYNNNYKKQSNNLTKGETEQLQNPHQSNTNRLTTKQRTSSNNAKVKPKIGQ